MTGLTNRLTLLLLTGAAGAPFLATGLHAQEAAFRIRSDMQAPLNDDNGWAAATNEAATVEADRPFRLRMEAGPLEAGSRYMLQARRNDGPWRAVEAHDFPHPLRELELSFRDAAIGFVPEGWAMPAAASGNIAVIAGERSGLLRIAGGDGVMQAIHPAPWPLPEFTVAASFLLPESSRKGFSLIFAYVDPTDYSQASFEPSGRVRVLRVSGGQETALAEGAAAIDKGVWHQAEVQYEGGVLAIELDDGAFELEVSAADNLRQGHVGIGVAAGDMVDVDEFVIEGVPGTPRTSIVATRGYTPGERTADLLVGLTDRFVPGFGMSLAEHTPPQDGATGHAEFEWPLVIRRFADGAVINEMRDRFAFRMVDQKGNPVAGGAVAQVVLSVPDGHVGGTFVENPGRIGPWQASNGDLYFIMEPTETDNKFMMMKSVDGGKSWREVDGANRPETSDLESVDSRLVGDRIEIVHQITESVRHHAFNTSDHPTAPDSWVLRDEQGPKGEAVAQTASMAIRPDGSLVAFYLTDRLHYAVRSPDGVWHAPVEIDPEARFINAGPQSVADKNGIVHLAYFSDDGHVWYRRLLPDGTLTQRQQLAEGVGTGRPEYGAVLPLAYDALSDTLFVVYRLDDGSLWERRIIGGETPTRAARLSGHPVITDAVDSQQAGADLVIAEGRPRVLYIDQQSRSIFFTGATDEGWTQPREVVGGILGSWVRGNVIRKPDGSLTYGFVYDAGSDGGAGMNRYAEIPLDRD